MSTLRLRLQGTLHPHLSLGTSRPRQLGTLHLHLSVSTLGLCLRRTLWGAAPALVVEYIASGPAVSYGAPAPVEYIAPAAALCAVPAADVKYMALAPIVGATPVPVNDSLEMTLVTPRGSMRRSTYYDENLGEEVELRIQWRRCLISRRRRRVTRSAWQPS